jgi:two-component system nitrate/nitrite response regulator NarL
MATRAEFPLPTATRANACLRVVVVSPVRLLREGLAEMLRQRPRVEAVLGVAAPGDVASVRESFQPNLVLVDVIASEGLDAVRRLGAMSSGIQVLAFGAPDRDDDVLAYAEAGLAGYIPRDASTEELFDAVDRAVNGELLCSPRAAGLMYRRLCALAERNHVDDGVQPLTVREREIVQWIDAGLSNKAIARELRIGLSTVKNHVHRILEKLSVTRRGEAAARIRGLLAQPQSRMPSRAPYRDLGSQDPSL